MKIVDKNVTEIIDTEYLEYAMYVLQSRAIPSAIDGFKTVMRKLVYAMIHEHGGKKVKRADLAGISKFNYHHGEASAAEAVVTLAADWNNNCPVFIGHGNYGSRMVQEAASPRYIYASLSPDFKKYFIDEEVAPKSLVGENPEPAHYLPILPWVLVNGISGIAVGFATNFLPRSIKDLTAEVKRYLKNPQKYLLENKDVTPTFPHFSGTITKEEGINQWRTTGTIEYVGKYTFKISELPIGYDRETYVIFLNSLIDKGKIKDFEDDCSKTGFGFSVKVTGEQKSNIDQDPITYFKLSKTHTENLTTIGHDGKLKVFKSVPELIGYFCDYRLVKFAHKIEYQKVELLKDIQIMKDKAKFIELVVQGKINFTKTTKADLLDFIHNNVTKEDHGEQFIHIPIYNCTMDLVKDLNEKIKKSEEEHHSLLSVTPIDRYLEVLK